MLDLQSTAKGMLFPRMTTSERNSIASPANSLLIFNTTTVCLEINLGTAASPSWVQVTCQPPLVSTLDCNNARLDGANFRLAASSVPLSNVSARVPYTGGNGKTHDGQIVTSTGVTGLTATLSAGPFAIGADSLTYNLSGTPSGLGVANFALNIGGQSCTLSIPVGCGAYVAPNTWKEFACYNLDAANTAADPFAPSWEIIGSYWQWGKLAKIADGPSGAGTSTTETKEGPISGWNTTPAANNAWEDASKTSNDPCPNGFRIPTIAQWTDVLDNNVVTPIGTFNPGASNYSSGIKIGAGLFLPAAGQRGFNDGSLEDRNLGGYYWSSSPYGNDEAHYFYTYSGYPYVSFTIDRVLGFPVRCIAE